MNARICLHVCMFACLHVCMFACLHVCMFACLHVCMFACLHVCMFACVHYKHTKVCAHVYLLLTRYVLTCSIISPQLQNSQRGFNVVLIDGKTYLKSSLLSSNSIIRSIISCILNRFRQALHIVVAMAAVVVASWLNQNIDILQTRCF